ncbi:tetratricopeptide repeat protein [Nakamurella leprariae]|uniref:Tetratricopeptide repeat protein n=1 Tax=Nakamurella leprariae TaxID=2803911 RepID=A0A938YIT3_9ACTN|nr:tetratricopeptide repeat protein [Nakamurella leprariae]MBM9468560.1 tetratricopeptide repeat protein [Nakamurella leprariae]
MDREKTWEQIKRIGYGSGPAKGYVWMDQEEEARIDARLAEHPADRSLLTAKGILNLNWDPDVAAECFSRALAVQPFDAHQHYNRGRVYLNTFRRSEALAALELAVRLDAEDNWKWHFLGVARYLLRDYEVALGHFRTAMTVAARHDDDLISCEIDWMWLCLVHLGRPDEAARVVATVTPETKVVPVIGDDEGYRDICLLLNGTIPVDEYVARIDPGGEGGSYGALFAVARYHYHLERDIPTALEYLHRVLSLPDPPDDRGNGILSRQKGWGYQLALHDRDEWERAAAALGGPAPTTSTTPPAASGN